ncbi:MAG: glycoside hydrolase family 127 protein [Bryobacteraceae bacterium]|nr:glycoside hydrolase family 127 protein [Bryobacteraceae bacterium]
MRERTDSFRLGAVVAATIFFCCAPALAQGVKIAHDYPVQPEPFTSVHFSDVFWSPRIEINRKVTIPFAFQMCEKTGRMDNFERAAAALRGEELKNKQPPGYPFDDTDIYKVIEGAAYTLAVAPDPSLEAYVDSLIRKVGAAQEKDGYLYTTRTIDPVHPHPWAGAKRWVNEEVLSHELYNLGHLYEAATAYYQATGKRALLDIALKSADLLGRTFGPEKASIYPGHQIAEMGLAKLYRTTGDEHYLSLAKFLLDARGPNGEAYNQANKKVVDQTEAVGHAVRATYMYSGMADVAALTGDVSYVKAIDSIWENVVAKKLYITGGIGSTANGEAFGENYDLPNMSAYNETCASIGNDYWNQRMFLLHGDAKYIDVLERTLYNGLISGLSLDGKSFFYPNPLESNGQHERSPWFGCACCPSNMTRFLASVPGYVYAHRGDVLYVNLFVANTAEVQLGSGVKVKLQQDTRYPWDGSVKLTVTPDRNAKFTLNVRIPGWARNEVTPSDLYRFVDQARDPVVVKVNGKPAALALDKGYAVLTREWKRGDTVELSLPMPVRRVVANAAVAADRDRVALQRGPLVYCAEWPDNPNGHVRNLVLADATPLKAALRADLLNGVEVIQGQAIGLAYDAQGAVQKSAQEFTAIPYYAWANRGRGQMMVWLPDRESAGKPLPYPTLAMQSKVTTSGKKNARAINDGEEPRASNDADGFFDWYPSKGTVEWAEYDFGRTVPVGETSVYWFDDTGAGECRVPKSWRVLYRDGAEWKPVENSQAYTSGKDRYNTISFKPVSTTGLRLEVTLQPEWSAGIQKWKVAEK